MRTCLLILALATPALALAQSSNPPANCGPDGVQFKVTQDSTQHTPLPVDPGKARVYFVQDQTKGSGNVTARIGIDGSWVGANNGNSWFSVPLEPGVHHICVNSEGGTSPHEYEVTVFTAEEGRAYYFRIHYIGHVDTELQFGSTSSDQALFMISSYPLSVSTPITPKTPKPKKLKK